jgi:GNAT superfamily N-acetyltransferase
MDELSRALELDRRVRLRGALQTVEIPEGFVVLHSGLPAIRFLNALLLPGPLPEAIDARAVLALTERWLGSLPYRHVVIDDGEGGQRLTAELQSAGAVRRRTLFMVFRGRPGRLPDDPRAREVTDSELRALQRANFEQADFVQAAAPGLGQALVEAQAALRAGTRARGFGAGEGDGLQSMGTLFLDPDVGGRRVAMVEEVATLTAYRERGLAKAVVGRAVREALRWGADLVTIPAEADDWPQLIYAKLGFEPVGIQVSFTLRGVTDS